MGKVRRSDGPVLEGQWENWHLAARAGGHKGQLSLVLVGRGTAFGNLENICLVQNSVQNCRSFNVKSLQGINRDAVKRFGCKLEMFL